MSKKLLLFSIILLIAFLLNINFVFAGEDANKTQTEKTITKKTDKEQPWDPSCIQTALEKRDMAIIAAFDKSTTAIKQALETRKSALKEAWAKTDKKERRTAVKSVWETYKKSTAASRTTFKKEKKTAWSIYAKDRINCKQKDIQSIEGGIAEGIDANL